MRKPTEGPVGIAQGGPVRQKARPRFATAMNSYASAMPTAAQIENPKTLDDEGP